MAKDSKVIKIALAGEGGFFENRNDSGLFGLLPGEVYRLKITEIPSYVSDTTKASDSSDTDDFLVL